MCPQSRGLESMGKSTDETNDIGSTSEPKPIHNPVTAICLAIEIKSFARPTRTTQLWKSSFIYIKAQSQSGKQLVNNQRNHNLSQAGANI